MASKSLNKNNSAVKRIMQEAKELANDPSTDYSAAPLEDDIFEWHCTLRGPDGTDFEGGLYHFRILLPAEYPFRPPSLMMLTPNGRFELNTKICISFTNYHEELWQPAWGVRTAIVGLQGFFPLKGQNAVGVGSIEYPSAERKRLAALSREWVCPHCNQSNLTLLPDPPRQTLGGSSTGNRAAPTSAVSNIPNVLLKGSTELSEKSSSVPPSEVRISQSDRQAEDASERQASPPSTPAAGTRSTSPPSPRAGEVAAADVIRTARPKAHKPPIMLDTAICVLLVMAFAMICRRVI